VDTSKRSKEVKVNMVETRKVKDQKKLAQKIGRLLNSRNFPQVHELLNAIPAEDHPLPAPAAFSYGRSILHLAVAQGAPPDLISALIECFGGDGATKQDTDGRTPLHMVAMKPLDQDGMTTFHLISKLEPRAVRMANRLDQTPMDLLFMNAVPGHTCAAMFNLLTAYPATIGLVFQKGHSLLHMSILHTRNSDVLIDEIIPMLLAKKKALIQTREENQFSPLHFACARFAFSPTSTRGTELVQLLIRHTPKSLWKTNHFLVKASSPLHVAIDCTAPLDVIHALLNACPGMSQPRHLDDCAAINHYYMKNKVPMIGPDNVAVEEGRMNEEDPEIGYWPIAKIEPDGISGALVRAMLVNAPNGQSTRNGELVIHAALYFSEFSLDLTLGLIAALPELISVVDGNGNLPIHLAAKVKQTTITHVKVVYCNILHTLCRHFPEGCRTPDPQGKLPLTLMIEAGQPWKAIRVVLKAHPAAILDQQVPVGTFELCTLLSRIDMDMQYRLLRDVPFLLDQYTSRMKRL